MVKRASTSIAMTLAIGPKPEPAVTDEEFFQSYLQYGVWLRLIPALKLIDVAGDKNSTELERLAAAAAFHQQVALQAEDVLANLVAWQARKHAKEGNVADLLQRIFLKRDNVSKAGELDRASRELEKDSKKKVSVDPRAALDQFRDMTPHAFLKRFGIGWGEKFPSMLARSPRLELEWKELPASAHNVTFHLAGSGEKLLGLYHNKIKHGPQVIVSSVRDCALRRGHPEDRTATLPPDRHLRALLDGSNVQETPSQQALGERVAPFLMHDPYFLSGMLTENMYFMAEGMRKLGYFFARTVLSLNVGLDTDPAITRLVGHLRQKYVSEQPSGQPWVSLDY